MSDVDLKALRAAFPPEYVGKLPRIICPNCSRGNCSEHNKSHCNVCGNYITPRHIHLDYVGHADVTLRLLDVDPEWSWQPKATDPDPEVLKSAIASGNPDVVKAVIDNAPPKFERDRNGAVVGLWINLTVGGVTRPGYGSCPANQNDAEKVLIGDALRNAAMRFGVATDLWAKGDRADPTAENVIASAGQAARHSHSESAAAAFENASPASTSGNGQRQWKPKQERDRQQAAQRQEQQQAGPDLGDWQVVVAGITGADDAVSVRDEVTKAYDHGQIEAGRANEIRRAIDARVAELQGRQRQQRPAAVPDPPPDAEDPESAFVREFAARTGEADDTALRPMKIEIARAVKDRKITPQTANELGELLKNRETELRSAA